MPNVWVAIAADRIGYGAPIVCRIAICIWPASHQASAWLPRDTRNKRGDFGSNPHRSILFYDSVRLRRARFYDSPNSCFHFNVRTLSRQPRLGYARAC